MKKNLKKTKSRSVPTSSKVKLSIVSSIDISSIIRIKACISHDQSSCVVHFSMSSVLTIGRRIFGSDTMYDTGR